MSFLFPATRQYLELPPFELMGFPAGFFSRFKGVRRRLTNLLSPAGLVGGWRNLYVFSPYSNRGYRVSTAAPFTMLREVEIHEG